MIKRVEVRGTQFYSSNIKLSFCVLGFHIRSLGCNDGATCLLHDLASYSSLLLPVSQPSKIDCYKVKVIFLLLLNSAPHHTKQCSQTSFVKCICKLTSYRDYGYAL